jgi:photosynthetic reaction center cytochrome c subunit
MKTTFLAATLLSIAIFKANLYAADEPTAEQSFKNIQVLKGIPTSELIPAMDFIRGALGVDCSFCHDVSGRYPEGYEKDEIPAKRTAREMIKMTRQINESSFHGRTVVTCASCHNGHQRPQGFTPVASTEKLQEQFAKPAVQPSSAPSSKPAAAPLPAADELFAKYEGAIGGVEAISKLTSRHVVGSITALGGQPVKVEAFYKWPGNLFRQQTTIRTFPVVVGFDGEHAYRASGAIIIKLANTDAEDIKLAGLFYRNLRPRDLYTQTRTLRKDKLGGKDVYVVQAQMKVPRYSDLLWFDAESGLLMRRTTLIRSVLGQSSQTTDFENYRPVNGVRMAMDAVQSSSADPPRRIHFDEVQLNIPIEDAKFAVPTPPAQPAK